MARSIRLRLQWWYGAVLGGSLLGFGLSMYWSARASWYREVDNQVESGVQYLDVHLRRLPPWFLRGEEPPPPGERPPPGPGGPPGNPGGARGLARLLEELRLPEDPEPSPGSPPPDPTFFEVRRQDGTVLKSRGVPRDLADWFSQEDDIWFETQLMTWRAFRVGMMTGPGETSILVGRGQVSVRNRLVSYAGRLWFFGTIAMALGLGGGWVVATGILKPIRKIAAEMASIRATDLSRRIEVGKIDTELQGLASAINESLDRLEASFQLQTRFTADASHEMRTPLAAIRSQCEMALRRDRPPLEYREALAAALRGVERLETLVENLLALARAESSADPIHQGLVDLQPVLDEVLREVEPIARSQGVAVRSQLESLSVRGHAPDLERMFANLVRNAVIHQRDKGWVEIRMKRTDESALIEIEDNGPGIPAEAIPHLGERFFRVDPSRSTGGSGLGLAISRGILQAHQGSLECESRLGQGTLFRVRLPLWKQPNGDAPSSEGEQATV